jgi:type III secretion protein D
MIRNTLGEIVLISGEQAGARARIKSDSSISISGSLGTDIVIRDRCINDEMLKLVTNNEQVFLQIIAGNVEIDGKLISQDKKYKLTENTKVKVGNTIFVHRRELNVPFSEILKQRIIKENDIYHAHVSKLKSILNQSNMYIGLSIVMVIIIVSVVVSMLHVEKKDNAEVSAEQQALSLLTSKGFKALNVRKNTYGQIVVSGFVLTNKERADIEKIIEEHSIPAVSDLKVGDYLAKEVSELFRINGVDVEASAITQGKIKVIAENNDVEAVIRIKAVALKEITDLKSLEIKYKISQSEKKEIGSEINYNEKDKIITMVVDGDPAYIMTADKSKYYIGALLPTGYKVVDIIEKQVVLEKKGKQTTLNF